MGGYISDNFTAAGGITGSGTTNQVGVFSSTHGLTTGAISLTATPTGYVIGSLIETPTAILSLSSTTQGFLMPSLTTTQRNAISSPATGLMLYNSTNSTLSIYSGTSWVNAITSATMPATFAIGDILYASTTSVLTRLAAPAANNFLISNGLGAAPSWTTSPGVTGSFTTVDGKTITVTKGIITAIV